MDGALFIYIFYAWHATNCLHTLYHMQKKDFVCTQTKMHTCLCHTEHAKRHTHAYTQGLSPQYSNPFKAYLRVRVREHTFAHIPKFSTTLKESRTLRHNHSAGSISTSLNVCILHTLMIICGRSVQHMSALHTSLMWITAKMSM